MMGALELTTAGAFGETSHIFQSLARHLPVTLFTV